MKTYHISQWMVSAGLAIVVGCAAGRAPTTQPDPLEANIDAAAVDVMRSTGVPSLSIAVVQDGLLRYQQSYGNARLDPVKKATPQIRYSIGSISKQFTAALILMLVQDGKMSLDDPVGKYLPALTQANQVTVRQVLAMIAGYQDFWPEDYVMTSLMVPVTPDQILEKWGTKPLDFNPGASWQYTNTSYTIAGRIAEIVGGKPLFEQLRQRIFLPLEMTSVIDGDAAPLPVEDAEGFYRHGLAQPRPAPLAGHGWMFGAGELAMTPGDLALWDMSLIHQSLLSPASYKQMFTQTTQNNGKLTGYGLGIEVADVEGHPVLSHSGEVSGFTSDETILPDIKIAILVLTNEDNSGAVFTLSKRIAGLLFNKPLPPPAPAPPVTPVPPQPQSPQARQALEIFKGLQEGKIDRSQFTPLCNDYFTSEALGDFASSLKPLGSPAGFIQKEPSLRGGMTFNVYIATFAGKQLLITTYTEPDGKLEQYLVRIH